MGNKKVCIWGYKLYSHTHSFIHDGFYRAFYVLGYDTYWFDDKDDVSGFDFSGAIILSEALACVGMPIRKDCSYILHNCGNIDGIGNRVNIQYLTYESMKYEKIEHGITTIDNCVFFPWGSPLLPHEFNFNDVGNWRSGAYFIGYLNGPNDNGNYENVSKFAQAAHDDGCGMFVGGSYTGKTQNPNLTYLDGWVSKEDEANYLRHSYVAPAIQGENQLSNGMIPCRIFKAISYGNEGVTNNPMAYEFFDGNVIYNNDPYELYYDHKKNRNFSRISDVMKFVAEKHTYINNIQAILKLL